MVLFVMRHGIAETAGLPGTPDHERALTPDGREETTAVARAFAAMGYEVEKIASSPLVRARQTAEIMSEHVGAAVEIHNDLASGARAGLLVEWLGGLDVERLMLVGHEPDLQLLIGYLIGMEQLHGIPMRKAAIAMLKGHAEPCGMELRWLATPEILTACGEGVA